LHFSSIDPLQAGRLSSGPLAAFSLAAGKSAEGLFEHGSAQNYRDRRSGYSRVPKTVTDVNVQLP
jgi:hypothetical protein